ncbi:hypothetical protein TWF694_008098 [Orbilia ellipsospora]|uniref:GPI inositol-deacylase winged helix domain-containing protein n=1 Tax=Orbilia ellipsospora TaxID=2528407 RepID=A0AAV9XFH9_9PEZI
MDLETAYLSEVEEKLRKLPNGLKSYYDQMLRQIEALEDSQHEIAVNILRWVVFAMRPLTVEELSIATDTTPTKHQSREEVMRDRIKLCGYFIKVSDDVVSLIHPSAKEYLANLYNDTIQQSDSPFKIDALRANLEIARKCFNYIQDGAHGNGPFGDGRIREPYLGRDLLVSDVVHLRAYPLLQYAALYWPIHARQSSDELAIFNFSHPFFQENSRIRRVWMQSYWRSKMKEWQPPGENFSTLHFAAFFGLSSLLQSLILNHNLLTRKFGRLANHGADHNMTPLHWAVRNGHGAAVELLIRHGADIEIKGYGLSPLIWAVRNNRDRIARVLIEHGANINATGYGMTALHWAAWEGCTEMVRLLLQEGADINATTTSQYLWIQMFLNVASDSKKRRSGEFPWTTSEEASMMFEMAERDEEITRLTGRPSLMAILSAIPIVIALLTVIRVYDFDFSHWVVKTFARLLVFEVEAAIAMLSLYIDLDAVAVCFILSLAALFSTTYDYFAMTGASWISSVRDTFQAYDDSVMKSRLIIVLLIFRAWGERSGGLGNSFKLRFQMRWYMVSEAIFYLVHPRSGSIDLIFQIQRVTLLFLSMVFDFQIQAQFALALLRAKPPVGKTAAEIAELTEYGEVKLLLNQKTDLQYMKILGDVIKIFGPMMNIWQREGSSEG